MKRLRSAPPSSRRQLCLASIILSVLLTIAFSSGCSQMMFIGKREARGVWMSRFEYAHDRFRNNPEAAKEYIRSVFRKARQARLNMVFFQVRGHADAFYRSSVEPWSAMLTGSLGDDPGWDPLAFAIEEAHREGLELHGWINTFPIWRGNRPPSESTPRHVLLDHPDWVVCDSSGTPMNPGSHYLWASPGIPAVREHVLNVVKDIVSNYDLDGIHFDYIRYPEESPVKGYSRDSVSVARFNSPQENPHRLTWDDWQREQVNRFVVSAYNATTALKPWVKVSAAVIGKYRGEGWSSYSIVYQDPARWVEWGKMDFIVPMVYWDRGHPTHPFVPLITQWQDRAGRDRQVMPGLSVNLRKKFGWSELAAQVQEVRRRGLPGVVFFAAAGLEESWETLGVSEFPYWSLPPAMPWKDTLAPPPPVNVTAERDGENIRIAWSMPATGKTLAFVIYRSTTGRINTEDARQILMVTGRTATHVSVPMQSSTGAIFAISSVDRLGNESALSRIVRIPSQAVTGLEPR